MNEEVWKEAEIGKKRAICHEKTTNQAYSSSQVSLGTEKKRTRVITQGHMWSVDAHLEYIHSIVFFTFDRWRASAFDVVTSRGSALNARFAALAR